MAKTVNIKLSSSTGSSTGPTFDLFSDANSYASAFESGVSKTTLMGVGGYTSTVVPDAATIIRVKSTGTCTTYDDYTLTAPTATPTATPTPTPTPTPTATVSGLVSITNCVRLTAGLRTDGESCPFDSYRRYTVTLYDSTGDTEVTATSDVTVTLSGTDGGDPTTYTLIIGVGQSSAYEDIYLREQITGECGDRDGMVLRSVGPITSITPSNVGTCPEILPPEGTVLNAFYRGQGLSTSNDHCGTNYLINSAFYATGSTISGLFNQTVYTTDAGTTQFNGLNLWYPVALDNTTNTLNGGYYVILINSSGYVQDIASVASGCGSVVPL